MRQDVLAALTSSTPRRRRTFVLLTLAVFVALTALRFAVRDPLLPVTTLFFIPVVIASAAYGLRGSLVSTGAVAAVYLIWSVTLGPDLGGFQIGLRVVALVTPWLVFGWVLDTLGNTYRARIRNAEALQQAHADLARRADELERSNGRLGHANNELERSNRDLERFAHVASHDLSEPLRVIQGFARILSTRLGPRLESEEIRILEAMTSATGRMQDLISDVLDWSQAGSRPLELTEVDVGALVAEVQGDLATSVEESGAEIEVEDLPTLQADPRQLRQLFQNLLANAAQVPRRRVAAPPCAAAPVPEGWRFQVRDNGIGIDPKKAEEVFRMFERLHGSGDYPGTGIGLAICQTVAQRHGGDIWVEPAPGGGSTFCFTLADDLARRSDWVAPPPVPEAALA